MEMPHPMPDALVDLVAERFRILGEPMRIRLLDRLREGDATVGELADALGTSQQNCPSTSVCWRAPGSSPGRRRATPCGAGSSDPSVMALCEQVCGGLRRHVAELGALLDAGAQPAPR